MSCQSLSALSSLEKKAFIDSFDAVISDCDGVLWLGSTPILGAPEVVEKFKAAGKKVFFLTNNGTQTRSGLVKKCKTIGFNVNEENIISTAWLTGQYLKNRKFNKKVFIVGSQAIQEELNEVGVEAFGTGPDPFDPEVHTKLWTGFSRDGLSFIDPDVGAVVVGYDFHFSLPKILKACSYLSNLDIEFIATNTDERFPLPGGIFAPGAGAFVSAVQVCAQRDPVIMGKPNTLVINDVLKAQGLDPNRCIMIGDRCNTDIYFGNQADMKTVMVETGVHKKADLEAFEKEGKIHLLPTYYAKGINEFLPFF